MGKNGSSAIFSAALLMMTASANAQQYVISRQASTIPQVQKSSDEVEIRGLRIGMPIQDAMKLVSALTAKTGGCSLLNISPANQDLYIHGDQLISCTNSMDYYGHRSDVFNVFAADGKVIYVIVGYFNSETKPGDERPSVYAALCEKYHVSPIVEKKVILEGSEYKIRSSFLDKNETMITTIAELEKQIDTSSNSEINEETKATVAFSRQNYSEWQQDRIKKLTNFSNQQKKKEIEKSKEQL